MAQSSTALAEPMDPPRSRVSGLDENVLSNRNFERLARHIYAYSGIKMPPSKRTMIEGRLRRCARSVGAATLNEYCDYLFDHGGLEREEVHLIDAATTNKTDFFREPAHFDYLTASLLPKMISEGRTKLKVWSAACSMGAEAYTLAMLFEEFARTRGRFDYTILGTDLSTRVLDQALSGVFSEQMIEPVPQPLRERYLMAARDPRRAEVRIVPQIRAKHRFARLNLMDDRYAVEREMDIIFCRNVLIYFDKPTQTKVITQLCDHLRPGGYLFLGHSESIAGINVPVDTVANTVFRRR